LHYLKGVGIEPGQKGEIIASDDDEVTYRSGDGEHTLTRSVGETVSVLADPSPPPRTALPEQLVLAKDRYGR
jgi:DtxR family Mn-dependent transcriptional regulator